MGARFNLGGGRWAANGILLVALALTACAVGPSGGAVAPAAIGTAAPAEARPLVIFLGNEPNSLANRAFAAKGRGLYTAWRMFNALPALIDASGSPQPELLSSLPTLNTGDWQVFPDGTMQTTYALRPNLTWHDGTPLTADDFVFSWRVYATPTLGLANQPPMSEITDVAAIDPQHFVIHWKEPYPDANSLSSKSRELPALPQHILGPAFDQMAVSGGDALATAAFWATEYVGLGPYRLQHWEPGSLIEAAAFDGYALGAPKIARIQLRFSGDQNIVVAAMLAGEAHAATDNSISQAGAVTLAQAWAPTQAGTILNLPSVWRAIYFQLRPELANPQAILDPRVRIAIEHAVDKQAISDGIYGGQAFVSETPVWAASAWGEAVDNSVPTYPLDLRAADTLLNEAGFTKGADGFYRGPEGKLSPELVTSESPDAVRELLALANGFQSAGLDVQQRVIPAAQAQDSQLKATFPTMLVASTDLGEITFDYLASSQIPSANNLWQGLNRGGWSSPEYDRLLSQFNTTLDRSERVGLMRQMLRVYGQDLPVGPLFFPAQPIPFVAALQGPGSAAPESNIAWNIYDWEFK